MVRSVIEGQNQPRREQYRLIATQVLLGRSCDGSGLFFLSFCRTEQLCVLDWISMSWRTVVMCVKQTIVHSFVLTSYCLVRSKQSWQFKSAASKTEFKEPFFFIKKMEHKTVTLHNDTTSWRNSWQVCSDILFENFFFISDFFHSELHNYIYLMFSFSFGVWTVEKENNIISEKIKQKCKNIFGLGKELRL